MESSVITRIKKNSECKRDMIGSSIEFNDVLVSALSLSQDVAGITISKEIFRELSSDPNEMMRGSKLG